MTFNKVETQAQAAAFNFLKDQSTVLHTTESNDVNINGVNVITATPTKGDVLCITRKMSDSSLLGPDKQDIVWVKGMTINFAEFPDDIYEPIGIVYKVRGRVAYVRYRTEVNRRYSYCDRFDITGEAMTDSNTHAVDIVAKDGETEILRITNASFSTASVSTFTTWLASQLASVSGNTQVSAEYVGPNDADGTDYTGGDGRCVVSIKLTTYQWTSIAIYNTGTTTELLSALRSVVRDIPANSSNVRNNGGIKYWGGCNFNKFLDYYSVNGETPTSDITTIINTNYPVKRTDFENNPFCVLLRQNYATYEDYIHANMLAWPIGPRSNSAIGLYADKGAEYTNILAKATYKDPANGRANTPLYGPAHYCATEVGANHTLLVPGKWWLPSAGDIIDLMEDVTFGTNAWSENPDIVNQVLMKLNQNTTDETKGFCFSMLNASTYRWTSTRYNQSSAYFYCNYDGTIGGYYLYNSYTVSPITQIEF